MRPELLLGQFAGEAARHLIAELLDSGGDEGGVEIVIMIHGRPPSRSWDRNGARGPPPACRGRACSSARRRGSPRGEPWERNGRCAPRPARHRRRRRDCSLRPAWLVRAQRPTFLGPASTAARLKSSLQLSSAVWNRTTPSVSRLAVITSGIWLSRKRALCASPADALAYLTTTIYVFVFRTITLRYYGAAEIEANPVRRL